MGLSSSYLPVFSSLCIFYMTVRWYSFHEIKNKLWFQDSWLCMFPTSHILMWKILKRQSKGTTLWTALGIHLKKKFFSSGIQPEIIVSYHEVSSAASTPRVTIRLPNGNINTNITYIPEQPLSINTAPVTFSPRPEPQSQSPPRAPVSVVVKDLDDHISQVSERELAQSSPSPTQAPPSPSPPPRKNFIQVKPCKDYMYNPKC